MKRVVSILILIFGLTSGDVGVGVGSGVGDKATTELYYNNNNPNPAPVQYNQQATQQYQNYVAPTGYYNYNYNNNPSQGLSNNYYTNQQKQDLFSGLGFGGGNQGGGFLGGNGDQSSGDNFDLSSGGGIAGTALAALGITKVTKLGLIVFGLFFFVIVPLFIIPTILGIVSIVMSSVGGGGDGGSWMENIRQKFAKDPEVRALVMSTFYNFANNEDCIEKISCAIGQRSLTRNLKNVFSKKTNKSTDTKTAEESASNFSDEDISKRSSPKSKGSLMSRISRAIKTEDCQVYKCSILSYFS